MKIKIQNARLNAYYGVVCIVAPLLALLFIGMHSDVYFKSFHFLNFGNRYDAIARCASGLRKFDVFFVLRDLKYIAAENLGDDLGVYFLFSLLFHLFDVEPTHFTTAYLIVNIVALTIFSVLCLFVLYKRFPQRNLRMASILVMSTLVVFSLFILDSYIWPMMLTTAVMPVIYLLRKDLSKKSWLLLLMFVGIAAICAGMSNQFRYSSGQIILLFVGVSVLVSSFLNMNRKIILCVLLVGGYIMTNQILTSGFSNLMKERDEKLAHNFQITIDKKGESANKHVIWHSLTTGIGFDAQNPFRIRWDDQFGFQLMKKEIPGSNPSIYSVNSGYESFLKNYYLGLWKQNTLYMIVHYATKLFYCLAFLILTLHVAPALWLFGKPKFISIRKALPFVLSVGLSILPSVLVYPLPEYFLQGIFLTLIGGLFILEASPRKDSNPITR